MGFTALVHLSLVRQKTAAISNFLKEIKEIKEVRECLQLTGKFDYQLRIITSDIPSFEKLLENKLGNIEEIAQLETSVVISTKKNSSVAPLDYKKEIILKR